MSNYKVYVNLNDSTEDSTELEARSPIEAAFFAGLGLGAAFVASDIEVFNLVTRVAGVGAVQHEVESNMRDMLASVLVEKL